VTDTRDEPLSPLDAEIELLLDRLSALEAREATPDEAPIRQVALDAIRARLRDLSRRCNDKTCRVRISAGARKAAGEE
jgi:hypothetical protein